MWTDGHEQSQEKYAVVLQEGGGATWEGRMRRRTRDERQR